MENVACFADRQNIYAHLGLTTTALSTSVKTSSENCK